MNPNYVRKRYPYKSKSKDPINLLPDAWHKEMAETNFRNTIYFHREELVKIKQGHDPYKQLSVRERRRLKKNDILLMKRINHKDYKFFLSDKAEAVLMEVLAE